MRQFDFDSPALRSGHLRRDLGRMPSELAIIGFAAFSLLAAVAMSYYCGIGLNHAGGSLKPAADVPVYEGKAVPRDQAQRPLGAVDQASRRRNTLTEGADGHVADPASHAIAGEKISASRNMTSFREDESRYSFPDLDTMEHAVALGSASALAASVNSQSASSAIEAPDGAFGSVAPVPESSAWSFAGVFALVVCAGHRLRRRTNQRS